MMLGTHACLPVIGVTTLDIYRLSNNKSRILTNWQLFFVAIGGILPDILWPHTSLHDRLTSYTHTLWFLVVLTPVVFFIAKKGFDKNVLAFTGIFVFAAFLHIFMDAVSGGVSFLYPKEGIWGLRLIPFRFWLYSDAMMLFTTLGLNIVRHRMAQLRLKKITSRD